MTGYSSPIQTSPKLLPSATPRQGNLRLPPPPEPNKATMPNPLYSERSLRSHLSTEALAKQSSETDHNTTKMHTIHHLLASLERSNTSLYLLFQFQKPPYRPHKKKTSYKHTKQLNNQSLPPCHPNPTANKPARPSSPSSPRYTPPSAPKSAFRPP